MVFCLVFSGVAATTQDTAWFEQHKKSNPDRFEGLVDQPNARSEYDVLSLLGSTSTTPSKLSVDKQEYLHVRYCRPKPDADAGPVFIEVRQLTGHVNYLMKAAPKKWNDGWNDFSWPVKDVIWADNINPNNLGVVIRFGQDKEFGSDIVPAVFSASSTPDAETTFSEHIQSYAFTLRVQHSIQYLSYETLANNKLLKNCYYLNEFHPCQSKKPDDTANASIEEGNVITLHLDMSDVPEGPVTVRVRGQYLNSDEELSAVFHFKHETTCQ